VCEFFLLSEFPVNANKWYQSFVREREHGGVEHAGGDAKRWRLQDAGPFAKRTSAAIAKPQQEPHSQDREGDHRA
jgi:hypothetical protein